jgi:hypothetical protein
MKMAVRPAFTGRALMHRSITACLFVLLIAVPCWARESKEDRISKAEDCCSDCRNICSNVDNCASSDRCANKKTDAEQQRCADKAAGELRRCVNGCLRRHQVKVDDTQQCSQALE